MEPQRTDELERDLPYWVALHRVNRLGAVRMGLLERGFPSMEEAWGASREALLAAGLDARTASALLRDRGEIEPEAEVERLAKAGVRAIPRPHPDYPDRLTEIADPPPVLYVRGTWRPEDAWSVAVVGTRRATAYGRQAAAEFARGTA